MNFLQFLKEDTTVIKNKSVKDTDKYTDKNQDTDKDKNTDKDKDVGNDENELKYNSINERSFTSLFNKKSTKVKNNDDDNYDNNNFARNKILENIHSDYKDFSLKTGDLIKVIRPSPRTSDSYRLCDIYCGYIGIIKTRFKSTNYATVILDAPNNNPTIYFPIEYLEKIN